VLVSVYHYFIGQISNLDEGRVGVAMQLHMYDKQRLQITLFPRDDDGQCDSGLSLKIILFEISLQWLCETSGMEKQEFLNKIFQSYHEKC
jgi:hypothetical protein